jgi:hypothetical protein
MNELLKEAIKDGWDKYIAHNGKTCYRTTGILDYYLLKCKQYNLSPQWKQDFLWTAKGNGYTFEYCERDIILAEDL